MGSVGKATRGRKRMCVGDDRDEGKLGKGEEMRGVDEAMRSSSSDDSDPEPEKEDERDKVTFGHFKCHSQMSEMSQMSHVLTLERKRRIGRRRRRGH